VSAFQELQSEMADTPLQPTTDRLSTALLNVAVRAVSPQDVAEEAGEYGLTLTGALWLVLKCDGHVEQPTPRTARLASLIRDAIAELEQEVRP
jgi:hypothetical protein